MDITFDLRTLHKPALLIGLGSLAALLYIVHAVYLTVAKAPVGKPVAAQTRRAILPLAFEPNVGQFESHTQFLTRAPGYTVELAPSGVLIRLQRASGHNPTTAARHGSTLGVRVEDANGHAAGRGESRLPGVVRYFIGNDPAQWHGNVPTYASVTYYEVYPGTDLIYHGDQGRVEFDFALAPKADPARIRLAVDDTERLRLTPAGDLVIGGGHAAIVLHKPSAYQTLNGHQHAIEAAFEMRDTRHVGFTLGTYDKSIPLVIDPVISYSSYFGGSGDDTAAGVVVDGTGNRYLTGHTTSAALPGKSNSSTGTDSGIDAYVTKLDPTGATLLYTTYVGGFGTDSANAITVDAAGNVYLTGDTDSKTLPLQQKYANPRVDNQHAFVAKLDSDGSLVYTEYLGGSGIETGRAILSDNAHNVIYVGGGTSSTDFPGTSGSPIQATHSFSSSPQADGFIAKLDADGNIINATYFGGTQPEQVTAIAIDSSGYVYIGGFTGSQDLLPISSAHFTDPFQPFYGNGTHNGFVAKVDLDTGVEYATYLGSTGDDEIFAIAADRDGYAYVTGRTSSNGHNTHSGTSDQLFPTTSLAYKRTYSGGDYDAFLTKINQTGSDLVYSTYLGGDGNDQGLALALTDTDDVWVVGKSTSSNYPIVSAFQVLPLGSSDGFATHLKINSDGTSTLLFSSYLGGAGDDSASGVTVSGPNRVAIAGTSTSLNFPTVAPLLNSRAGAGDAFVLDIDSAVDAANLPNLQVAVNGNTGPVKMGDLLTYTVTLSNQGTTGASGIIVQDTVTNAALLSAVSSAGTCSLSGGVLATCEIADLAAHSTTTIAVNVAPSLPGKATNTIILARTNQSQADATNKSGSIQTLVVDKSGGSGSLSYPFLILSLVGWLFKRTKDRTGRADSIQRAVYAGKFGFAG